VTNADGADNGSANAAAPGQIYVTQSLANSVALIDGNTNTVFGRVALTNPPGVTGTPLPRGIAYTNNVANAVPGPVGPTLYTANEGNGTVSVIDVNSSTLRTTINLNVNITNIPALTTTPQPRGVAVLTFGDPVTRVYVTDQANNVVHVIDGGTNSVVTRIALPTGARPDGISACLNCTGAAIATIAVANTGTNNVSIIGGFNNQVVNTIPVGTAPAGITLRRNTFYGYVANSGSSGTQGVSIIDMRNAFLAPSAANLPKIVVGTFFNSAGQGAFRVTAKDTTCINPSTGTSAPCNELYTTYTTTANVLIVRVTQAASTGDPAIVENSNVTTLPPPPGSIGAAPKELSIVQDSRRVYVANANSAVVNAANNSVSVIEGRVFVQLITR